MRYVSFALVAFLAAFLVLAAHVTQKPNLGHLVCVNAHGQRTNGADWKVCHTPRSLLNVMFNGE